ncbi:hypothetical protein OHC33_001453 [Knufia fluminis]|uniref:Uncharacterized protein n=1 Tax=Knufia fluminis TaxID=191047 RepID=A0AAN8EJJ9_9EURO|nr:hypothetical protein OHC33_001453 [Knufia fluminis]
MARWGRRLGCAAPGLNYSSNDQYRVRAHPRSSSRSRSSTLPQVSSDVLPTSEQDTKSPKLLVPVYVWPNFDADVVKFLDELADKALDDVQYSNEPRLASRFQDDQQQNDTACEADVRGWFHCRIDQAASHLAKVFDRFSPDDRRPRSGGFQVLHEAKRKRLKEQDPWNRSRVPDIVITRGDTDLVCVVEMKMPWKTQLFPVLDLYGLWLGSGRPTALGTPQDPMNQNLLKSLLGQSVNYMHWGNVKIGCLSTHDETVFIRIVEDLKEEAKIRVEVSPVVHARTRRREADGTSIRPTTSQGTGIAPDERYSECTLFEAYFAIFYRYVSADDDGHRWDGSHLLSGIVHDPSSHGSHPSKDADADDDNVDEDPETGDGNAGGDDYAGPRMRSSKRKRPAAADTDAATQAVINLSASAASSVDKNELWLQEPEGHAKDQGQTLLGGSSRDVDEVAAILERQRLD